MLDTDILITAYFLFWLVILGGVTGSFLDCMAYRMAEGGSIRKGRSHCGNCGHVLGAKDLIPVFSYLFYRGRCRYCKEKIPSDCIWAELSGIAIFAGTGIKFGFSPELLMWLFAGSLLLLLSFVDVKMHIIPNKILLLLAVNRIIFFPFLSEPPKEAFYSIITGVCGVPVVILVLVLILDQALGRETMGGGDIKLLFVLGLYLDWMQMLLMIFMACLLGLASAYPVQKQQKKEETGIPFGPSLAVASLLVVWFGGPIITWYQGFF